MKKLLTSELEVAGKIDSIIKSLLLRFRSELIVNACSRLTLLNQRRSFSNQAIIELRIDCQWLAKELDLKPAHNSIEIIKEDIFDVLLSLAYFSPLNELCLFSWEPISKGVNIYSSVGYQYDITPLVAFINKRKGFIDPYSNEWFSVRDIKHIIAFAKEHTVSITAPMELYSEEPPQASGMASFGRALVSFFASPFSGEAPSPRAEELLGVDVYETPLSVLREFERRFQEEDDESNFSDSPLSSMERS